MTRINWDEVSKLTKLDEIIAYSIITLQEAYTAPRNDDLDVATKKDVSDWVRWEIAYDEVGRAYFVYAASLYVVDKNPLADVDFLNLINAPTKWLVNHASVSIDPRAGDTSLAINTLADLPLEVKTMEQLLFWAIVLGDWWNRMLKYIGDHDEPNNPPVIPANPIGNWGFIIQPPGLILETEDTSRIDAQFDSYNGFLPSEIPDFLEDILSNNSKGAGKVKQEVELPPKDKEPYRENLATCAEQDPKLVNYSRQQLEVLLPKKK